MSVLHVHRFPIPPGSKRETILVRQRRVLGASLRDVAELVGMTFSLLAKIEDRIKPCPLKHAFSLSEYYGYLIEELFDSQGYAMKVEA